MTADGYRLRRSYRRRYKLKRRAKVQNLIDIGISLHFATAEGEEENHSTNSQQGVGGGLGDGYKIS